MNLKNASPFLKIIAGAAMAIVAVVVISHASLALAQPVNAQPTDKPVAGDDGGFVPCGNTVDNPCTIGHLFSAFVVIINYLIGMAGFIAVLALVYAGFMMIYSQGQGDLKEAKSRFSNAIIGLVLVALAFVLVNALFEGSLSLGVKKGPMILSSPLEYIQSTNDGD